MQAHQWRSARLITTALAIAIVGLVSVIAAGTAQAAPPGAATNLNVYNQQCVSGGKVLVSISWSPSQQGTQWFDVSRSSNFSGFSNQGPLASNAYYIGWTLDSNTTYYGRVATFTPAGIRNSDTLQFHTINCGANFTAPHSVDVDVFSNYVHIDWQAGNNNLWYCVDTAFTYADLVNISGSWHNWGCGTTNTELNLNNLACGREHYARVWAAGPGISGYSEVVSFVSQPCSFSAPTNPRDQVLSSTSARLAWDRGNNNLFFCVDLARSQSDLQNLTGSWFNTHCGTTATVVDVTGLQCGTTYWWRTWAAGPGTSGYTAIDSFTTNACAFRAPVNLDADVIAGNDVEFEWDEVDDAFWFCVDVAESQSDLTGFTGTWANYDCGGTDEVTVVSAANFECGETYYWRVFAYAGNQQAHSQIASFTYDHTGCP